MSTQANDRAKLEQLFDDMGERADRLLRIAGTVYLMQEYLNSTCDVPGIDPTKVLEVSNRMTDTWNAIHGLAADMINLRGEALNRRYGVE